MPILFVPPYRFRRQGGTCPPILENIQEKKGKKTGLVIYCPDGTTGCVGATCLIKGFENLVDSTGRGVEFGGNVYEFYLRKDRVFFKVVIPHDAKGPVYAMKLLDDEEDDDSGSQLLEIVHGSISYKQTFEEDSIAAIASDDWILTVGRGEKYLSRYILGKIEYKICEFLPYRVYSICALGKNVYALGEQSIFEVIGKNRFIFADEFPPSSQ